MLIYIGLTNQSGLMKGKWFSITIAVTSVTLVACFCPGFASFPQNAFGQAEETFSQNTTFLEEVEEADRQLQTDSMAGQTNNTNITISNQIPPSELQFEGQRFGAPYSSNESREPDAKIIVAGQNTYIVWESNETGDWEVMLRASNDYGETFGKKINLSNSSQTDSENAEIAALGNKVFVVWYESKPNNGTSESVFRVSNDSGHNFGPLIRLSKDGIIGDRQTFHTYVNSTYGVQLKYPTDWQVTEGEDEGDDSVVDIAGFFSPTEHRLDPYDEKLWISLDDLRLANMTLEEYSNQIINYKNQSLQNFRLLDNDTESSVLGGYPAYRLVYTSNIEDGIILKQMEMGTIIGGKVYYIDYYAELKSYDRFLPIVQEMINSLKVEQTAIN